MEDKKINKYIPTGTSILRAGVSLIPLVGGVLDHLLFDKADEIRTRNLEQSISEISKKMGNIPEENITKEWFESTEAIEMFRQLIEKVQFESDNIKIKTLSDIYAISGTTEFSSDPNKFAVLRKVAELTTVQKELLLIVSKMNGTSREFNNGGLQTKAKAIWFDDIMQAVKTNPKGQFWKGIMQLDVEIGIIESLNLMRNINVLLADVKGYELTSLGILLVKYLQHK